MRRSLITRTAACGLLALAACGVAVGTAGAAEPAAPLQVEQTLFTGDPWPVSYQTFSAATASPGHARITVDRLCNSFNRGLCLDYTRGATISWLNTSTGQSGRAVIPDGASPGAFADLPTGAGVVATTITSASPATTLFPGLGVFTVH